LSATGTAGHDKFQPVRPLQLNKSGAPQGDSSAHPTNTSPIKRRASQAEELLKAEDAGGRGVELYINFEQRIKNSLC